TACVNGRCRAGASPVAWRADGTRPVNEQTELDIAAGRRLLRVASNEAGESLAAIVTGGDELDLVVTPASRGRGVASEILGDLLPDEPETVSAWSHGDHPAAARLAATHDFVAARRLLRLVLRDARAGRIDEPGRQVDARRASKAALRPEHTSRAADRIRVDAFRATDADEEESWLRLNARIFADHPEQGRVTLADLHDRMAEAWFTPEDFLVARDEHGAIVGYNWTKVESGAGQAEGEIYVLGVAPERHGQGLGRRLLDAGLDRLARRGCTTITLYVEGDNEPALGLYRAAGFTDDLADTQYRRRSAVA
ncbi:MAG TPA: mycothiol synthase, partial [Microbacteriaceae bacterium]|nr:mycothiol synthase [Microbacteriaceae bacterium]